jgi:tetratricopeptide (TPR) repeat protein
MKDRGVMPISGPPELAQLLALLEARRFPELEAAAEARLAAEPRSGILWKLLGVAQRLQGKEALPALGRAAELLPDDPEAQGNLGAALLERGRLAEAEQSLRRALELAPDSPLGHTRLGAAARRAGRFEEALRHDARALELDPRCADAHYGLGNAQWALGRTDDALASYRAAIDCNPRHAAARVNFGNALLARGRREAAVEEYAAALALVPDLAEAHGNLGNALRELGRLDAAVASYRRALELRPEAASVHSNLGDALRELGLPADAASSCRRALEIDPRHAGAHNGLGNALLELGLPEEAAARYRRALEIKPDFAAAHVNLGGVLRTLARPEEAQASAHRALAADAGAAAGWVLLGDLHADAGRFADAETAFRRAVALDPGSAEAWAGIASQRRMTAADAPWLAEAERLVAAALPARRELTLRYAMGKYFDDLQDYDRAFGEYRRANELARLVTPSYDRDAWSGRVAERIATYDRARLERGRAAEPRGAGAVFIVGMPRSGTTLAEQILASHPSVFGAGELSFWERAAARRDESVPPATLANDYLAHLAALAPGALRVVDKMPANFLHLGLIHAALPQARILHLQRDPLDTCLSIHFQQFRTAHPYAHDLGELAHHYNGYRRLMRHWRSALPEGVLLEVPYERLVEDPESWSRRMLDFLGLPWDPVCLDFHLARRTVTTASKWQVRQKISRGSVGRWRHYARFLDPLIAGLDAAEA